ncbi:hypothetical protein [Homoserinimonas hongtaonis]|uniref:hypothetical protein n=1 Tax=Homoserinimonas hongtaonis TaxID=2079791 RepID=UPI000D359E86|nr:hypothetical protein [Salinibacterium hongtaonis]AWB90305.1 hypothetical protein C2138_12775 [Salinibacterium hongtaonis]
MIAPAAARDPWYLLPQASRDTAPQLPSGAPIAARLVHGAYYAAAAPIRADIRAGNNSRRVGIAFDQLDARAIVPLRLSRRERGSGIDYLVKLEASKGGVL